MKNYYALLEIAADAPAGDVKKSFRAQIARYHPDKVQHLGREFQAMAADRAAELTEAYRILSDADRRAEYDRARAVAAEAPAVAAAPEAPPGPAAHPAPERSGPVAEPPTFEPPPQPQSAQFAQERARRDTFVRKATMDRFRQAFAEVAGTGYNESSVRGFDFASIPKSKMFGRGKGPALLGRFVSRVDAASVAEAWGDAGKWKAPSGDGICVILMSTALAPAGELATAIHDLRRRSGRASSGTVTLIPVNSSVWDAHMPTDAPDVAKDVLTRLRSTK